MDIRIKTSLWENGDTKTPYISNIIGNIIDNKITYMDDAIKVAIILESDKITLKRESDDYLITLNLNGSGSTYYLKQEDKILPLNIDTKKLVIKDQSFYVKYELEENVITFILEYEVL